MESKAVEERIGTQVERIVTLEDIRGMESAKRMLEVALCGAHPLVLVFNANSQAADLIRAGKRIAQSNDLLFHGLAYPACNCDMYATATRECRCKRAAMRRHLGPLATHQTEFDLWMDACCPNPPAIGAWKAEAEDEIVGRIVNTVKAGRSTAQPDTDATELLNAWQKQAGCLLDAKRILDVAKTIASMDGERQCIRARHVAEAIQYQASSIAWLWQLIRPNPVQERTTTTKERS